MKWFYVFTFALLSNVLALPYGDSEYILREKRSPGLGSVLKGFGNGVGNIIGGAAHGIGEALDTVGDTVGGAVKDLGYGVVDTALAIGDGVQKFGSEGIPGLLEGASDVIGAVGKTGANVIRRFTSGFEALLDPKVEKQVSNIVYEKVSKSTNVTPEQINSILTEMQTLILNGKGDLLQDPKWIMNIDINKMKPILAGLSRSEITSIYDTIIEVLGDLGEYNIVVEEQPPQGLSKIQVNDQDYKVFYKY